VVHGWATDALKAWRTESGKNVFANRYEANDVEGNVRAMFDLSDGKVDIWIVPGLIPGDVNEKGEIEVKRPKPPPQKKIKTEIARRQRRYPRQVSEGATPRNIVFLCGSQFRAPEQTQSNHSHEHHPPDGI
jgi:hypothetical protein